MTATTKTASTTATNAAATETRRAADTFFRGFTDAMDGWMNAHRRMVESMSSMCGVGASASGFRTDSVNGSSDAFANPMLQARARATSLFNGGVDVMTAAATELATIAAEQMRFAGRVAERNLDCMFGPHAARSPEAVAATGREVVTDCVENAAAVGERVVRLGARNLESLHALLSTPVAGVRA